MARASVNLNATGQVVAKPDGLNQAISVKQYVLVSNAIVTVQWQSYNASTPTSLTGPMLLMPGVALVVVSTGSNPVSGNEYVLQCAGGDALYLVISGTGNVSGHVSYDVPSGFGQVPLT